MNLRNLLTPVLISRYRDPLVRSSPHLRALFPQPERAVRCHMDKVLVGRQQRQSVADTEMDKQGVHGADLGARATALVTQFGGVDVILPVRHQQRA